MQELYSLETINRFLDGISASKIKTGSNDYYKIKTIIKLIEFILMTIAKYDKKEFNNNQHFIKTVLWRKSVK